jgi:hypothetical protein
LDGIVGVIEVPKDQPGHHKKATDLARSELPERFQIAALCPLDEIRSHLSRRGGAGRATGFLPYDHGQGIYGSILKSQPVSSRSARL